MSHINELDRPNLTEDELFRFLHDDEQLSGVTRRSIRDAVLHREILPTVFGNRHRFSKRDGLDWIASLKERPAQAMSA
ncbi:hypothetical protein [Mycolicibacterium lacusdiani]|uniref:hypothetical protein n=1 Tax=Mycolicibacterium lacusdiani TaxID=2895283 RepID=UPI001F47755C|nr:hypothetical protein [Mycolicibacterium lacusdiani]